MLVCNLEMVGELIGMQEFSPGDGGRRVGLTLRVGVTGHKAERLQGEIAGSVRDAADDILACLARTAGRVAAGEASVFRSSEPRLRLVTSFADGADMILADAALAGGWLLDVILPFREVVYAADFSAEDKARLADLHASPSVASRLVLDEVADPSDEAQRAQGYLAAGRAMLDHADVIVAVWDGKPPRGPGGTGQVVREAIERGLIVVWIGLDGVTRIWEPAALVVEPDRDGAWSEITFGDLSCPDALSQRTAALLQPPVDPASRAHLDAFLKEPARDSSLWFGYDLLRRLFAGRPFRFRIRYDDPGARAGWTRFGAAASERLGEGFSRALGTVLASRALAADALALHYSHAFRSAYVFSFGIAALGILVGALGFFLAKGDHAVQWKAGFILLEMAMVGFVLWVVGRGHRERWHERWLEYRQLAELLRSARLPAIVGRSVGVPDAAQGAASWVGWYVRASLREMGPPSTTLDAGTLRAIIETGLSEEIEGQIRYHEGAKTAYRHLSENIRHGGEWLFRIVIFGAVLFILYAAIDWMVRPAKAAGPAAGGGFGWADFFKTLATVIGTSFPALGSALFGIRATGDFDTAAEQSERMERDLRRIADALRAEAANPTRERTAKLFAEATQAMAGDLRIWSLIYRHRELEAG